MACCLLGVQNAMCVALHAFITYRDLKYPLQCRAVAMGFFTAVLSFQLRAVLKMSFNHNAF
jgi:hypothetical protein